jgi:2-hydroxychromene-2-carboxylate isomerase
MKNEKRKKEKKRALWPQVIKFYSSFSSPKAYEVWSP